MTAKTRFFILCLLILPFIGYAEGKKAITWEGGSRLGDCILDYTHAKWLSYKYGIPLLFKPFDYSDQLVMHHVEEHYTPEKARKYDHKILSKFEELEKSYPNNVLFAVRHHADAWEDFHDKKPGGKPFVAVGWEDPIFLNLMRTLIAPKNPLNLIIPPKNVISVALHYRTGGDYDTEKAKKNFVFRFANPEFYVDQLNALYELVDHQPLYVFIFTDDSHPAKLKNDLKAAFPHKNVKFDFRKHGNKHDQNVLEDLFSLMEFDCLIRPNSHFSMLASHLTQYKILMYPKHGIRENGIFKITEANIVQTASWDKTKKRWIPKKERF